MELGYGKLRRNHINTIQYSIHPDLGLAWGDGHALLLTPLTHVGGQLSCGDPVTLRNLERVQSAAWSAEVSCGCRYLALSTGQGISVWLTKGTDTTGVTLENITHLDISPLPQGLLWHPSNSVLCILAPDKIVVMFNQHGSSQPVVLDVSNRGHICTGVWVTDGDEPCLLVAVKKKTSTDCMLFPNWDTNTKPSLADAVIVTMKTSATVRSMTSVGSQLVAMTTDLPIESLCCQVDMSDTSEEQTSSDDIQTAFATGESGPVDLTALCTSRQDTPAPPLLFKQLPRPAVKETAELVLFRVDCTAVRELSRVGLPGIITPDLITADPTRGYITVGSNAANMLQVFSLEDTTLRKLQPITLTDGEKVKGLHTPDKGCVVAMVGKPMEEDFSALLPISTHEMYQLKLRCFQIEDLQKTPQKDLEKKTDLSQLRLPSGGTLSGSTQNTQRCLVQDITPKQAAVGQKALHAARSANSGSWTSICRGTEDLPFLYVTTGLESPQHLPEQNEKERMTDHQHIRSLSLSKTDPQLLLDLKETLLTVESLEAEMNQQMKKIARMKRRLTVYSGLQSPECLHQHPEYPILEKAEIVRVAYEDSNSSDRTVKTFLLDKGLLKLEALQEVFGLRTVELCHDGDYIVVTANKEGYIPVTFAAGCSVTIRGKKYLS